MEKTLPTKPHTISRKQLNALLSASPAMLYALKLEAGVLTPYWVSNNIKRIMGCEPEECLGDPEWWSTRLHPDDRERVLARVPTLFSTGYLLHEYRFRRRDGRYIWVRDELRGSRGQPGSRVLQGPNGTVTHFVGCHNAVAAPHSALFQEQATSRFDRLTRREREVFEMVANGYSNKATAAELGISIRTAEKHRMRVLKKLEVSDLTLLVRYAIALGISLNEPQ